MNTRLPSSRSGPGSFVALGILLFLFVSTARACPFCQTPVGREVHSRIFDEHFWRTLASVAAPFPVFLLGLWLYHIGLPKFWDRRLAHKTRESETSP